MEDIENITENSGKYKSKGVIDLTAAELNQKFTEIYNSTYDGIFRYVLSKCRNSGDIPDIVQNTYLNLYTRMSKRTDIKEPIKYLVKTAKHELYKIYGIWNLSSKNIPVYSKADDENFEDIERELLVETDEINNLLCEEIWKYIKNTDILTYKIFVLYFQYDEKLRDIAETLKVNESTVKNRLFRTLKQIKEKYNV
ncbi:MAG: sigma-70 family RNA polymerase sigma factor [Oscillospiraceae bacterium]|nr:sigma-70 family RNA polymerase sigma factor [Oscillospiraceae bacterium]